MRNLFAFPLSIPLPLVGFAGSATGAPGELDPTFGDGSRVRFGFGSGNDCVRAR